MQGPSAQLQLHCSSVSHKYDVTRQLTDRMLQSRDMKELVMRLEQAAGLAAPPPAAVSQSDRWRRARARQQAPDGASPPSSTRTVGSGWSFRDCRDLTVVGLGTLEHAPPGRFAFRLAQLALSIALSEVLSTSASGV